MSYEIEPFGTGGAIKQAERLVDEENFLVINGDSFLTLIFHHLLIIT
jgi:NDP-sugar pyrophosphorylase family protein